MIRILGPGLFGLVFFGLWIYCIFDVIATDEALVRNLHKTVWLLIVIFVPTVGSIAWLALGRPAYAGIRPGDTTYRPPKRIAGPEDDPTFGQRSPAKASDDAERLRKWEEDLRRREDELRRGKDPGEDDPPGDQPYPFTW